MQAKALQTTSPTRLRGATDDSTTSNDHPGIVGSATDADTSKDAVPDASAQPVAPSTADFAIAGPVTPETSPVIQQTAPLTQQAQPDTAGLPADAAAAAAQHQQASSSFIQAPMSGAIVALPISSEVANSTIDHMGTGASLSQMASIPNGPTPQLAPGSALQKQRLAMTDPSLQAAAAGSNIYHGVGGSSALVGSSPTVRTSLTEQRGVSGPAVGTQMPGTAANMHSASLGSHQVPNVLSAAQRSAHGNVGLPGQPAANSSASTLFGAHHAAYQTLPRLQSGWELSSFASDTQAVSAANPQGSNFAAPTWPHANPAYSPRPGTPASGAPQQFSMPPGAQVTVPKTHPQPTKPIPQMKLDPNLQARQMLARSNAMTNAHAIVPGMGSIPNSAISRTGTAWQVGLAAGLAATANMRPPPTSTLTHQAATTAAAARAAAAFQASRALSMAKGYTQPLQQGVAGAAPLGMLYAVLPFVNQPVVSDLALIMCLLQHLLVQIMMTCAVL